MLELQDNAAFKDHLRDFLVQTKSFSSQDNADLFADEAAAAREVSYAVCFVGCLFHVQPHTSKYWLTLLGRVVSSAFSTTAITKGMALCPP